MADFFFKTTYGGFACVYQRRRAHSARLSLEAARCTRQPAQHHRPRARNSRAAIASGDAPTRRARAPDNWRSTADRPRAAGGGCGARRRRTPCHSRRLQRLSGATLANGQRHSTAMWFDNGLRARRHSAGLPQFMTCRSSTGRGCSTASNKPGFSRMEHGPERGSTLQHRPACKG